MKGRIIMKGSFRDYFEKQIGMDFEKWVSGKLYSGDSADSIKAEMIQYFNADYFYKQQFIDMEDYIDSFKTYMFSWAK